MSTFDSLYEKLAGGTVGNWLAIIGLLSLIYWGWLIVAAWQNRAGSQGPVGTVATPTAAVPPAPAGMPPGDIPGDIVVIAAAVHAMLGAGRIIHLLADDGGRNWANEGRWMQQISHKIR